MYGDDPVASNNMLLGQFDIVNIPPAPKDVPRIEVREDRYGGEKEANAGRGTILQGGTCRGGALAEGVLE